MEFAVSIEINRKLPTIVTFYPRMLDDVLYWAFTPPDYSDRFRVELKDVIPYDRRSYDQSNTQWLVHEDWMECCEDILYRHFPNISCVWGDDDEG
jgi:hypothetical protein